MNAIDNLIHNISNAATPGRVAIELILAGGTDEIGETEYRELLDEIRKSFARISGYLSDARRQNAARAFVDNVIAEETRS